MRKRWSVVIVGQSGLAASHRAEVGRHRSEAAARRAAEAERERLHARGDTVHGYRVVLEHDGQEVAIDPVAPRPAPPSPARANGAAAPEDAALNQREETRRAATISIPEPPPGPVPEEILARWARDRPEERESPEEREHA